MSSLSVVVAGVKFESCVFNASGPLCATIDDLRALGKSSAGAIVTKSATKDARVGNEEPRYADIEYGAALQSMGLPNLGFQAYIDMLPTLRCEFPDTPIIVSVAGLCAADNEEMLKAVSNAEPDLIELNLSCPNIPGKPQVAYDFEESNKLLARYCETLDGKCGLGLKLPPYFDPSHHDEISDVIKSYQNSIKFVTTVNSVGNVLCVDPETEKPVIKPKNGFGGLSGPTIKPVGLANVNALYRRLPSHIDIIGVGGISTGTDAFEYLLVGAKAVQVGTCLWREGPSCFERIGNELKAVLEKRGYACASDAVGKLKPF
eukprot:Lankesteria_metandrocarpae@DN635_c0_g1_i1.p1